MKPAPFTSDFMLLDVKRGRHTLAKKIEAGDKVDVWIKATIGSGSQRQSQSEVMAPSSLQQLLAASALIVTCEKIVGDGVLPEPEEARLRELIVQACKAFEIATIAERSEPRLHVLSRHGEG